MNQPSVIARIQNWEGILVATVRYLFILIVVFVGTPLVVVTALLPIKVNGAALCAWLLTYMCRAALLIANIDIEPFDRKRIYDHQGFIFCNHQSYLEVVILFNIRPGRYLAKAEIGDMPIAKTLARRVGTIFVKREDTRPHDC